MQGLFLSQKITRFLLATAIAVLAGCTGNSSGSSPATTTTTTTKPVTTIQISGTPTAINTGNTSSSAITVTALDANNAAVSGATITLSVNTGQLSSSTLITDAVGKATANFSSGTGIPANQSNRTATISATAGAVTALLPVQIVGSTLALTATGSSLPANGTSPVALTITAKDAGGSLISGAAVALTQTGGGTVTLTPASGTTNSSGQLVVSVAGVTAGTVTVNAAAVGATAPYTFTVAASGSNFGISLLTLNAGVGVVPASPKTAAMQIGDTLAVQVTAPAPTASVVFASTIGTWSGATVGTVVSGVGTNVLTVTPAAGIATATLSSATAGVAGVQVLDPLNSTLSDTLSVGITAKTAAKILLQASPTVISRSVGSTLGYSNLTAMVYDTTGAPVGNAPVAFSIVSGTGTNSGETVSPVVVFSAATTANGLALGSAPTTFTSGSLSSGAAGVQVRASVVGTAIATQSLLVVPNPTTSSFDVAITIGGTAGSVAFGQAAKIGDAGSASTIYTFPMSVLVADANGSPAPPGTVVNISTWPIAWTTGSRGLGCDPDPDGFVWDTVTSAYIAGNGGTFYNEDANQNLILDAGEDGKRKYFFITGSPTGGSTDSQITPLNSYGGTVVSTNPADKAGTATTDATGLATFTLTYTKSSAFWIISRIRAQTVVQGSPAVGQLDFPLAASLTDSRPTCFLPKSPFAF
jgi:hypothetical protein